MPPSMICESTYFVNRLLELLCLRVRVLALLGETDLSLLPRGEILESFCRSTLDFLLSYMSPPTDAVPNVDTGLVCSLPLLEVLLHCFQVCDVIPVLVALLLKSLLSCSLEIAHHS